MKDNVENITVVPSIKGFVENTIPQRQYENIKIHYEFNSLEEKDRAVKQIIQDCLDYKDIVSAAEVSQEPSDPFDPIEVAKYYKLPENTKLQRVYNKQIGEYLYFDPKNGKHYNQPKG